MKTGNSYESTGCSKQLKVFALSLCAMLFALCASAEAQQEKKLARIGYLGSRSSSDTPWMNEFRAGLSELGYIEGQNIIIEYRYWEGKLERLPELAAALVRLNCDILLTGGVEATEAAKNATKTIPIVMAFSGADPVRRGIITSLAQPGGNITGLASINADLSGKRLELLKEVVPKLSKVAMLSSPTGPAGPTGLKETQAVARSLRLTIQSFEVKTADEIEAVFKTATKQRAGALMVHPGGFRWLPREANRRASREKSPTSSISEHHVRGCRRADDLCRGSDGPLPSRCLVCGQNFEGSSAGQFAGRAAHDILLGYQPERGEADRPDDSAKRAGKSG
jgi:putative ABC transport system substrate-binding protein